MIKTKIRGQVEDKELTMEAYQVNDQILSKMVIDTDIPPILVPAYREIDIIQSLSHRSERTSEGIDDDELGDDVQFESDEKVMNFRIK